MTYDDWRASNPQDRDPSDDGAPDEAGDEAREERLNEEAPEPEPGPVNRELDSEFLDAMEKDD